MDLTQIQYTGKDDAIAIQGYLSLTFRKEWFFSADKNCYGIPVRMECCDTTGDAFFSIRLRDARNDLDVGLHHDYCQTHNAVIWICHDFKDGMIDIDTSVDFCGTHFAQSVQVDLCNANLSISVDADCNLTRAQNCYNSLDLAELWNLWENQSVLDGIALDTVLKNKLRPNGYVACPRLESIHDLYEFENVYYCWCGWQISRQSEILYCKQPEQAGNDDEMNALKVSAYLSLCVTQDGHSILSGDLPVFSTDKAHPNSDLNDISRTSYDLFMKEIAWDNDLTNLVISFDPDALDDVLDSQYLDVPVLYCNHRLLLRLIFSADFHPVLRPSIGH